MTEPKKKQPD